MWNLDDVHIYSPITRDPGDIVYTIENTIAIDAFTTKYIDFIPQWNANTNGVYAIKVSTELTTDQNNINDIGIGLVEIFEDTSPPVLSDINDYPDPQVVDGFVNISLTATDETTIDSVYVDITGPAGFNPVNVTMASCGSNQRYYYANYSVIGNYTYFIWANDTIGHSVKSSIYTFSILNDSYQSLDINLNSGWNLITVSVDNDWMASSLAENITGCEMISWFDAGNQTYKTHIVGVPGYDFEIQDGYGLFILVNQIDNLNVVGGLISNIQVPLGVGWNMIGWYHEYSATASSLAGNISGCQMVSWFDSVNQTFKTHIVGVPGYDFTIARGMGLFILVDTASVWLGEG
jgi:hypothetical protein